MKKFMALSMAAIMALTVAGCGSKPAETTAAGTTAETAANADTTAAESAAEEETSAAASGKKTSSTQIPPLPLLSLKMKRERW